MTTCVGLLANTLMVPEMLSKPPYLGIPGKEERDSDASLKHSQNRS
jgi:hypothetical protein